MARKTKEEAEKTRKDIIDAARRTFHACGVSRSSLEKIASAAGVTRGAIYWHFQNKAELFFAMREDVFAPMVERADALLFSRDFADPLDAIEAALSELFRVLEECPVVREVFEIMMARCEYVDEFASVQDEVLRPGNQFQVKIEGVYRAAQESGTLREGLTPEVAARDTRAFSNGLLNLWINAANGSGLKSQTRQMITDHIALRRRMPRG